MNIAILGYGVEGKSAEKFLRKQLGHSVSKLKIEIRDIKKQGKDYLKNLEDFDMVVRSPGIPYLLPEIQKALRHRSGQAKTEVTSTTKLFFEHAKGILVGITGTKGKGTTAALLYMILKAAKKDAHLIGNMGIPMLDELPKLKNTSISILELSSFQLQDMDVSPHIAIILDVSPDHLNYHKNFKEYLEAKTQIVKHSGAALSFKFSSLPHSEFLALNPLSGGSDAHPNSERGRSLENLSNNTAPVVFYFPDNKYSKQIAQKSKGKKNAVRADKNLKLKIPGAHNIKNASMAAAVASSLGVKEIIIKKAVSAFKGLPHRLEFVRKIHGIKFYNDSASTNPAATAAAVKAFKEPKILIAGGAGKNLDYLPIGKALKKSNTKLVILFGRDKQEIGRSISGEVGKNIEILFTDTLAKAVNIVFQNAKKGDVVILSPAAASFDQFTSYAERGRLFKAIVAKLK